MSTFGYNELVSVNLSVWNSYIAGFKSYLQLERSLSENTVEGYLRDVEKLAQYLSEIAQVENRRSVHD